MSSPAENDPLHARLQEFLKRNLEPGSGFIPQVEQPGPEEAESASAAKSQFEFNLTPRQVKEHLDRFVIKQDEAKKVLAITVCDALGTAPPAQAMYSATFACSRAESRWFEIR